MMQPPSLLRMILLLAALAACCHGDVYRADFDTTWRDDMEALIDDVRRGMQSDIETYFQRVK